MTYTDGIVIRCPECGVLNILIAGSDLYLIRKCLNCEGSIMPINAVVKELA